MSDHSPTKRSLEGVFLPNLDKAMKYYTITMPSLSLEPFAVTITKKVIANSKEEALSKFFHEAFAKGEVLYPGTHTDSTAFPKGAVLYLDTHTDSTAFPKGAVLYLDTHTVYIEEGDEV